MCETCKIYVENFTSLKSEYQRLQAEHEAEKKVGEQAKVEIDRLLGLLDERKDDVKQLDHERKMVIAQCESLKDNMERLQKLYGERQSSALRDTRTRHDSDQYITGLQAELRKATDAVGSLQGENNRFDVAINDAKNTISSQKSEIATMSERLKHTAEENSKLNGIVLQLQNDLAGGNAEIHSLKSTLEDVKLEKAFVTEEARVAAETRLKGVERDNRELKRQLENTMVEKTELVAKVGTAEVAARSQIQRERDDTQQQLSEMQKRFTKTHEQHKIEMKNADTKVQSSREELEAVKGECANLRSVRSELQSKLSELTSKANRAERREEHLRHELHECNIERGKLRGEIDKLGVRLTEAKKNEAKIALLDVKMQYKDQEVVEARQEKDLAAAEGARILTAVQRLNKRERHQLQKAKREQVKLLSALKEYMARVAELEEQKRKLAADHDAFVKHAEVRLNAAAVMAPSHSGVVASPSFVPDPDLFGDITENLRRTAALEKRQHLV